MTGPVVLVEDDPDLRAATRQMLRLAGFEVSAFEAAAPALAALDEGFEGPVISDIRMPGMTGLQLFDRVKALDPELPVILVTGHGDIELAVAALKDGAYDFIPKPFDAERLIGAARRAAAMRGLVLENRRLRAAAAAAPDEVPLLGESGAMRRLREMIRDVAPMDVDVLIEGETGAGKEVVARLLHHWSARARREFVALNCGALPESVLESELFGHEAGAFTGAAKRRVGRIEHADKGTLFLDEIESCPPAMQVKLLRVLETREVEPLGTNARRRLDLRVVAASKVDLGDPGARGGFREDLYYRLNVVTLRIPPLRERKEDAPLLFAHFARAAAARFGRPAPEIGPAVAARLAAHDWPGNVRELAHYAERVVLGLEPAAGPRAVSEALSLPERVERFEAEEIRAALRASGGDPRATMESLGLPKKTFYDKLRRYGIARADFAEG